jgi:hypothetical protein
MVNEMERVAYSTTKIDKPMWDQEDSSASQSGSNIVIPEDLVRVLLSFFLNSTVQFVTSKAI